MYIGTDIYRDQIVNMSVESSCDVGLSLHSKMHQCLTLFPVLFLQSLYICPSFREFFHLLVSTLFILGSTVPCEDSGILVVTGLNLTMCL